MKKKPAQLAKGAIVLLDVKSLGEQFRILRNAKGLTQEQLKEKTGYSHTHIIALEKGKTDFNFESFSKFCEALEVQFRIALTIDANDFARIQSL